MKRAAESSDRDVTQQHIFLILDKYLQELPFESMPNLRGRSVSRIPDTLWLRDQIERPKTINGNSVFYILNPSQDLKNTEKTFQEFFKE